MCSPIPLGYSICGDAVAEFKRIQVQSATCTCTCTKVHSLVCVDVARLAVSASLSVYLGTHAPRRGRDNPFP